MRQSDSRSAPGKAVFVRLDDSTNERLIKAKNRSGRSKSNELTVRLKDHLERFPDFYNAELTEVIQNNLDSKSVK
ncbi:TraY domain-containing protein [Symbiopectobacterium purcellii]|uniref:TraY domain-containing protein n=1 Tax=Symbiopectobacterium purcellii TaxID=2871826 RepID=UPI003F87920F